jgi:hypothetical protein
MSHSNFLQFWLTEKTRTTFLSAIAKEDLATFRLTCHDFSVRAAPHLFEDIDITFRAGVFTKPARMAALDRIGKHVRQLTFTMPHSSETFLPPLIDPVTGEEKTFIYKPVIQPNLYRSATQPNSPTYGSWEMTDLLVKQYSPLFHAAANVPSFVRACSAIPNLKHLKISCPGQESSQRYRRDIVDYALISLRIAVERTNLVALDTLSLSVHPGAVLYLNPITGLGALPNSVRRWRQIRTLSILMDSVPSHQPDHLKLLHAYLEVFTPSLHALRFRWVGPQGPCPLSLPMERSLQPTPPTTPPALACPRTCHLPPRPVRFRRLQDMEADNVVTDARQIAAFITAHRRSLREFRFDRTRLSAGSWDDALAPLTRISGNDRWKERCEEIMDVPLFLSPVGMEASQVKRVWADEERAQERRRKKGPRPSGGPWGVGGGSGAGGGGWNKAGAKGRELLSGTEEHMKRFLRASVFSWL